MTGLTGGAATTSKSSSSSSSSSCSHLRESGGGVGGGLSVLQQNILTEMIVRKDGDNDHDNTRVHSSLQLEMERKFETDRAEQSSPLFL